MHTQTANAHVHAQSNARTHGQTYYSLGTDMCVDASTHALNQAHMVSDDYHIRYDATEYHRGLQKQKTSMMS